MHSTLKLLEIMVFPECNKAGIDLCMRKPIDPPAVDPKAGKLLGICEEEDGTQGPTFPMKDSQLPH